MRYYETPVISGTTEQQLRQIKEYLHRQTQDLNHNLQCVSAENIWRETLGAVTAPTAPDKLEYDEEMLRRGEYVSLKGLIIKAATEILKYEDSVIKEYNAAYLAKSEFGEYFEQAKVTIDESAYGITELYNYATQIKKEKDTYITDLEGYIARGILEKDDSSPVFGVEIGYNKNEFIYNGKTYTNVNPSKIRITPDRIGFYNGSDNEGNAYEVAYISERAVYFPLAHITGGTIKIGEYFSVDEQGNMKATNAELTGTVNANAGYIGGFEITGDSDKDRQFWPCSIASVITPTDGVAEDDYQYAVFLRGNNTEKGTEYGAVTTEHNVFGIKKRAQTVTKWDNDESPYVFRVSLKGNILCNEIEVEGRINGKFIKAHSDRIALGYVAEDEFTKDIELLTKGGNIYIGSTTYKPSNIALTATYVRSNGDFIPYQTGTFNLGHEKYVWAEAYIRSLATDAGSIYFCANAEPDENITRDLGSAARKWKCIHSDYLTAKEDELVIGTRGDNTYTSNIFIRTQGYLLMGQDAAPIDRAYIVASNTIRIGQYSDTLKTVYVYMLGTTITISGTTINLNGTVNVNGKPIS